MFLTLRLRFYSTTFRIVDLIDLFGILPPCLARLFAATLPHVSTPPIFVTRFTTFTLPAFSPAALPHYHTPFTDFLGPLISHRLDLGYYIPDALRLVAFHACACAYTRTYLGLRTHLPACRWLILPYAFAAFTHALRSALPHVYWIRTPYLPFPYTLHYCTPLGCLVHSRSPFAPFHLLLHTFSLRSDLPARSRSTPTCTSGLPPTHLTHRLYYTARTSTSFARFTFAISVGYVALPVYLTSAATFSHRTFPDPPLRVHVLGSVAVTHGTTPAYGSHPTSFHALTRLPHTPRDLFTFAAYTCYTDHTASLGLVHTFLRYAVRVGYAPRTLRCPTFCLCTLHCPLLRTVTDYDFHTTIVVDLRYDFRFTLHVAVHHTPVFRCCRCY